MAKVKHGDTVKVHYTGLLEDGTVFSSTLNSDPLQFTIGKEEVITGFEEAVLGMKEGEATTIKVPVNKAYGKRRDENIMALSRDKFPRDSQLEIGQQLSVPTDNNRKIAMKVADITETTVCVDINHPLSGRDLLFDIKLLEIN
jgi:peptidylprolyl isomerase